MNEESIFGTIQRKVRELFESSDDLDDFDMEYLMSEKINYNYLTFDENEDSQWVRCNLCGKLFELNRMDKAVQHVGDHSNHGDIEIDPFEPGCPRREEEEFVPPSEIPERPILNPLEND